ncbi:Crp/Fnr family transcriptional regulator [Bradyrhizobium tropiciagri]|uniref:Crp/Fnr family transcriptional regulator n=1 Tax=Bradyrhizobium tropiciagri TaxID=312253 RepID=UPI001009EC14|nr:helix-turn-helix domain-containing protein [Bradyrhizobium tropiciagri]
MRNSRRLGHRAEPHRGTKPRNLARVAKLLYRQLRAALRFGADVLTLPPTQRVAARLSDIAEATVRLDALPLSQQALGEMTGLTRKTVNEILQRLQADGVLVCDYRRIEIRDVHRLRDIARLST